MAFEIFSRKIQRGGPPSVTFTTLGRLSFNMTATAQFEKNAVENVLLLWDKEKRLIGVRPITKKDLRAYKVHYGKKGNGCGFSAKTFLRYIGYNEGNTRSTPARWNEQEEMFIIEVPGEYLRKSGEQPITPAPRKVRRKRLLRTIEEKEGN
jgi:hypothetical protein